VESTKVGAANLEKDHYVEYQDDNEEEIQLTAGGNAAKRANMF
jgi:hypothetical protein